MKLIIPAYIYPGGPPRTEWSNWIAHANSVSHIIANPGSPGGPGTSVDSNYAAVIAAAQLNGIKILGYVDCGYAAPFTSVPQLDDFNTGASQLLTARTGWAPLTIDAATGSARTDAVPTYISGPLSGTYYDGLWNTTYGADQDAWLTVPTNLGVFTVSINARITSSNPSSVTNYLLDISNGVWELDKTVLGVFTQMATGSLTLLAGDQIGIKAIGTQIEAWYKPAAGSATRLAVVTDAAISGSSKVGVVVRSTARIDAFGGGEVATVQKTQVDLWKSLYGINDIFFDQVPSGATDLAFTQVMTDYVYLTPGAKVMLNHGTDADVGYSAISDIQCTFEGTKATYDTWMPSQAWELNAPAGRICHLVYNCASNAEVDKVFSQARMQNVSYMRGADTSIWFAQSAFIAEEYNQTDFINAPRLVGGFGTRSGGR